MMNSPIDLASGNPSAHRDHRSDAIPIAGYNRASKMPRKRRTTYITRRQATKLIEALEFAEAINLRLNVAIDICWSLFSGFTDDQERIARCQERLSKWCKRQGYQLAMIWVREMGKYGSPHVHILMFVPPWLMEKEDEFRLVLERMLEPEGGPTHEQAILIRPAYDPRGKLDYLLKGMPRREAKILGIIRTCSEGEIVGKRVGYTESIGLAARKRYWLREANRAATIAATFNNKNFQQKAITTSVPSEIVASKFEGKLAGSDAPSQQPKKSKPAWKQFIGNELPIRPLANP